jgi:hypothetical protein
MILIVLGTDHFVERHFLLTLVAPVTLNRVPRRRECTGILNVNLDFQPVAAVDDLEALHNMQLGGVRCTEIIHIGPVIQSYGIDHQRVAVLIMSNGLAVMKASD